jgi:signal transduction histidine kinase
MRERAARIAGEFSIVSTPEQGTSVQVSVPAARAYQGNRNSANDRNLERRSEPQEKAK